MILDKPHLRSHSAVLSHKTHGATMRQQRMVKAMIERLRSYFAPAREVARSLPKADEARDLVHAKPMLYPIAQPLHYGLHVTRERVDRPTHQPSASILDRLR